jgi:hypothetical protein
VIHHVVRLLITVLLLLVTVLLLMVKNFSKLETPGEVDGVTTVTLKWPEKLVKVKVLAVLLLWPLTQKHDLSIFLNLWFSPFE